VREASSRGLAGFMVNWVNASDENARLAEVLRAANEINAGGENFKIILDYRTNGALVPIAASSIGVSLSMARAIP